MLPICFNDEQSLHASSRDVHEDMSRDGKTLSVLHFFQAYLKSETFPVFSSGKLFSKLQSSHVDSKLVMSLVSSKGNAVKLEQPSHVLIKESQLLLKSMLSGNSTREEQFDHASCIIVPLDTSSGGKEVRLEHPDQQP